VKRNSANGERKLLRIQVRGKRSVFAQQYPGATGFTYSLSKPFNIIWNRNNSCYDTIERGNNYTGWCNPSTEDSLLGIYQSDQVFSENQTMNVTFTPKMPTGSYLALSRNTQTLDGLMPYGDGVAFIGFETGNQIQYCFVKKENVLGIGTECYSVPQSTGNPPRGKVQALRMLNNNNVLIGGEKGLWLYNNLTNITRKLPNNFPLKFISEVREISKTQYEFYGAIDPDVRSDLDNNYVRYELTLNPDGTPNLRPEGFKYYLTPFKAWHVTYLSKPDTSGSDILVLGKPTGSGPGDHNIIMRCHPTNNTNCTRVVNNMIQNPHRMYDVRDRIGITNFTFVGGWNSPGGVFAYHGNSSRGKYENRWEIADIKPDMFNKYGVFSVAKRDQEICNFADIDMASPVCINFRPGGRPPINSYPVAIEILKQKLYH
jgi:hypothetical protein